MDITNSKMLSDVFKREIRTALNNISKTVYEQLRKNVKNIYSKSESIYYARTYDFFNAIIKPELKSEKDGISVVIGIDYSQIKPKIEHSGRLNAHADINGNTVWNGISISEALLSWLDKGTTNSSIHNQPETNYWYNVMGARGYEADVEIDYKKLDSIIQNEIKNTFSRIGSISVTKGTN